MQNVLSRVLPRRCLGAVVDLCNSAKADAGRYIVVWYGGVGKSSEYLMSRMLQPLWDMP